MAITEPGVYDGVPFADYLKIPAVNHSSLRRMAESPLHYRHAKDQPASGATDAMRIGTALHVHMLERERFSDLVAVSPVFSGKGSVALRADWQALHEGMCVIDDSEHAQVLGMGRAISAHPEARKYAEKPGLREVVVVWIDEATGLKCKARCDKFFPTIGLGVDIKTTRDASPEAFEKSIADYGYHTQLAFYAQGVRAATKSTAEFIIVAVENESPHGCAVYEVDPDAIAIGEAYCRHWLARVAECEKSGVWPGYSQEVMRIGLPVWAAKRARQEGMVSLEQY